MSDGSGQRQRQKLLGLIAGAYLVRLVILLASRGSNDIAIWMKLAEHVRDVGVVQTYVDLPYFNHPPLMGWYAAAMMRLADWSGIWFPVWFKLLPIAGDALATWMLWRWSREDPRARWRTAAIFAWSPAAILISAHHGNTDILLASFILGAALLARDDRALLAGLFAGAAVNVKVVALLIVPVLFVLSRGWRAQARFLLGFALALLPFVPVLLSAPGAFYRNAFAYNSNVERWGLSWLLPALAEVGPLSAVTRPILDGYLLGARYLILALAIGWALLARRTRRIDPVGGVAVTMALFLVLTPGFGIQYLVWGLPVLLAAELRTGVWYSAWSGAYALVAYLSSWNFRFPAKTSFVGQHHVGAALFGVVAWIVLASFVWRSAVALRAREQAPAEPAAANRKAA